MTQKTDSPDGAAELLISLLLSSLGRQICLLAFRLAIALTTAAVSTPEGGPDTRPSPKPIISAQIPFIKRTLRGDGFVVPASRNQWKQIRTETVCEM